MNVTRKSANYAQKECRFSIWGCGLILRLSRSNAYVIIAFKNMDKFLDDLGLVSTPKIKAPRVKPLGETENQLHRAVVKYLTNVIARPGQYGAGGVVWYSIESRAQQSAVAGFHNKMRGTIAGCPDVDLYWAGRAYKIELKTIKGSLSESQKILHPTLKLCGVRVAVCRTLPEVALQLVEWEIPHRRAYV